MSNRDRVARSAHLHAWPDPTDEQLSLVARILGPHVLRARAERLAAEQAAAEQAAQPSVERIAA
ncbi:hypothetical protein [Streptomyces sp. NRRL B-24484]|uniref:hypothetical protein n=1 Tax=Streptomyces sp. NRRL B-24484 TaxID=1463833 RepID=UPI0013315BBA|nr:hypothetical protein [Streptomyces sp. NRRL B-24484]